MMEDDPFLLDFGLFSGAMSNSRSASVPHLHPHPPNSTPSTHNLQTTKTRIVSVHQKIQENAKGPHVYHMIIFLALVFSAMLIHRNCPTDNLFWKFFMPQKFSNKNWGFSQPLAKLKKTCSFNELKPSHVAGFTADFQPRLKQKYKREH